MFELLLPFKGTIISLHTVTSSCILISRHEHVLSFISISFWSILLTSHYQKFWFPLEYERFFPIY